MTHVASSGPRVFIVRASLGHAGPKMYNTGAFKKSPLFDDEGFFLVAAWQRFSLLLLLRLLNMGGEVTALLCQSHLSS